VAPYQVRLDQDEKLIFAPLDDDKVIRTADTAPPPGFTGLVPTTLHFTKAEDGDGASASKIQGDYNAVHTDFTPEGNPNPKVVNGQPTWAYQNADGDVYVMYSTSLTGKWAVTKAEHTLTPR
jgi:hypothetical protein